MTVDANGNLWFAPNNTSTDDLCVTQPQPGELAMQNATCSTETYLVGSVGIAIATTTLGGTQFAYILSNAPAQSVTAYPLTLPTPSTSFNATQSFIPNSTASPSPSSSVGTIYASDFSSMPSLAIAPLTLAAPAGGTLWVAGLPSGGANLWLAGFALSASTAPTFASSSITHVSPEVTANPYPDSFLTGAADAMAIDAAGHLFVAEPEANLASGNGREDIFGFQIQSGAPLALTQIGSGYIPASLPNGGSQHRMALTYQGTILDSFQVSTGRVLYELSEPTGGTVNQPLNVIQSVSNNTILGAASGMVVTP